jgi:phage gp36-like protein
MKIFEKGSSVHATDVYFVKSNKLYTDEAKTNKAIAADVLKSVASGRMFVNVGTNFDFVTSVKLDGTKVVVGSTEYTVPTSLS